MKYKDFNHWELAEDAYFVNWVLRPNKHADKFWKQFLADHPEKSEDVLLAREIVTNIRYTDKPRLNDTEYNDLFERIISTKRSKRPSNVFYVREAQYRWVRYVAAVTLVLASAILYNQYWLSSHPSDEKTIQTLVKESPRGSKLTAVLSDGSKVKLNAGSKITYPKEFSDTLRLIYLTGEAFFEVESDPARPFRVKSDKVNAEVLGTSFNVRAYPDDRKISVAVAEGKVKVTNGDQSTVRFEHTLLPFQESEINVQSNQVVKRELQDDMIFAWTNWKLVFKEEPLSLILKRLERWYGVEFELKGAIKTSETYSGSFDNDPLKVVLEVLTSQDAFDYEIQGRKILITSKY